MAKSWYKQTSPFFSTSIALFLLCALSMLRLIGFSADANSQPPATAEVANLDNSPDAVQCRQNLAKINTALQKYRAEKKQLPNWLSDLVPQYLEDINTLSCPVTRRTGKVNNFGLNDPKLATSYLYEFCNVPIPPSIAGGSRHTMREWKEKQAEIAGDVVPIVRCHNHPRQLSLSLGGRIFENTNAWEGMFSNRIPAESLSLSKIFPGEAPLTPPPAQPTYQAPAIIRISARDPQAPSSLIDLTDYYNAGLNEGWHRVGNTASGESDLSWLPKGLQSFAGTDFDVRGIVQLAGKSLMNPRYPQSIKGIRVNRKCTYLNFLHATGWNVPEGTRIGHYRVVYAGGDEREIPITYGLDVRDWYMPSGAAPGPDPKNSVTAWMGKSPATQAQGVSLRLFKTAWENPLASTRIETLDYVSAMTNCAPFLIAITAE